jgi:outer membrane receptor for ferrienterochelin and colicins
MRILVTLTFLGISFAFMPPVLGTVSAQTLYSIKGKVVSGEDGLPVAGASVQVLNTMIGTATGADGTFRVIGIPDAHRTLSVSALGFLPSLSEFASDIPESLLIVLTPSPLQSEMVVVTANKRPQSLQEVPVSISIVDAQDITKRNVTAVDDALRYLPGVNFQQSQINIRASSGYSRGVGSRVLMLVDGVPLLSGDTGEITFESIPVSQIERVEVVKGAGSALYGSGAMGGVINVLTKEIGEGTVMTWRMYGGIYSSPAFDQWKWSSKERFMNGQMFGISSAYNDLKAAFSLQRIFDDGYREQDWSRRYNGSLKVNYSITPYGSVTWTSNLYQQYRGDFLWWNGLQQALRPADAQRNVSVSSLRFNNALRYRQIVNDRLYYEVKAVHFRGNWYRDSLNNTRLDGSISDSFVMDAQANLTADEHHHLTFGLVANAERVRANIFGRHDGRGGAVYVQEEFTAAKELEFTFGLRHDLQQVVGLPLNQQTSPKFGVRYTIDPANTLRASVGRGFRSPSIGEFYTSTKNTGSSAIVIPSTSLRPEQSWSFEIGSTHILSDRLTIEAALFSNEYRDLIEANVQGDTVLKAVTVNFTNITQARIRGGEFRLMTNWFEHSLSFDLHYNYNWAVDAGSGAFLRFRPRHIAGANAELTVSNMTIGADYRFVSRIEAIDDKLVELAPIKNGDQRVPIHVADVRFSADLTGYGFPFRASVIANNVLGYSYNELIGNVSPPRHFMLMVEGIIQ